METESRPPEEILSRREREKAAHRQEIIEAAVRVFARKGFTVATMDEIAQEAEFSKGAIYLHFANKEDLLSTILTDLLQNTIVAGIQSVLTGTRRLREELTDLFRGTAEFAFSHHLHMSASMPLHLSQLSGLSEETRAKINDSHQQMIQILSDRVARACREGELRDVSLDAIVGLIHGTLDSMVLTRWGLETVEQLKDASDHVIEILFGGIEARKE